LGDLLEHFAAVYRNLGRSFDSEANLVAADLNDDDAKQLVTDDDFFALLATKNQHFGSLLPWSDLLHRRSINAGLTAGTVNVS
jgi:hypothetical protein